MCTATSNLITPSPVEWYDLEIVPYDVPLPTPALFDALAGVARARAVELWRAAVRLDVAIGLVGLFEFLANNGYTISTAAGAELTAVLPELNGLKGLLDRLAEWPMRWRSTTAPPPGVTFPEELYVAVTGALRTVILRDGEILETAGAVTVARTFRRRRFPELLDFRLDKFGSRPSTRVSPPGLESPPPHALACRVVPVSFGRYFDLREDVRAFWRRLEASPVLTLERLSGKSPVEVERGHEPVAGPRHGAVEVVDLTPTHADDFSSVKWFGTTYHFTPLQRKIVALLWADWERGGCGVGSSHLLDQVDSNAGLLRELFRLRGKEHPAWGTMIVTTDQKGVYRLADPSWVGSPTQNPPAPGRSPRKSPRKSPR
jgi:hypothetical protein